MRAFLVLVAALALACGEPPGSGVVSVESARLKLGGDAQPPPAGGKGWRRRPLPDAWGLTRRRLATEGWYRSEITLDEVPHELWAIYVPWVSTTLSVFLNGRLVGNTGPVEEPLARNRRPALLLLPPDTLHAGTNTIDMRMRVSPMWPALFDRYQVGPAAALRPLYERRFLLRVTLLEAVAGAGLLLAALIAGLYLRRDPRHDHRWLVVAISLWALATAATLVRVPPIAPRAWLIVVLTAVNAVPACFAAALHRRLGLARRRVEIVLVALVVASALAVAAVPEPFVFAAAVLSGLATAIVVVYVLVLAWSATSSGAIRNAWLVRACVVAALLLAAHDFSSILLARPPLDAALIPYSLAAAVLVTGWAILAHLAAALRESERLNVELEDRVRQKHAELAHNYERLHELERERAVAAERERITQDIHDGIGGHLVSALSLAESGRATPGAIADVLHDALDDLRTVIDSLDPVDGDLASVLALARSRLEPRLAQRGLRFDWRVNDLPPIEELGPERILQVLRIVQEAITNILKHAGATRIVVRTATAELAGRPAILVEVGDDGHGFTDATQGGGRGLAHMRRRAAALGGRVAVESGAAGTRVRLWLPRDERPADSLPH